MSHTFPRTHVHTLAEEDLLLREAGVVMSCLLTSNRIGNCRLVHQSHSMQIININFEPMSAKQMNQFCFECNMGTMSAFLSRPCVRRPVWTALGRLGLYNSKVL